MLVVCPFPFGVAAGQRLKFEQYYCDWRAAGWDVAIAPYMDMALWNVLYERGHFAAKLWGVLRGYLRRIGDLARLGRFDLVYCHMSMTPLGTSLFERLLRARSHRLLFDVEDNVILDGARAVNDHPNPLLRYLRGTGKARYLIRTADHVVSSSPALNERCLAINQRRKCSYVSSSVDTDRFVPANSYSNERPIVIGWTGTFSSRVYLDLLRPVFRALARRRDFRLRVIGNFDYDLPGVDLEVIRWTAEREVEDLQGIDIGVYPLTIDEWVTGKSGLKAIQYMAFGLPCVATDVGTTPDIIRHGENGLLVRTEEEWMAALEQLIDQPGLRRRLGEQARADAVARYSIKAVAADYRRALASAMEAE
ncbi:MAG: glycosyltransferase family 4 protein [Sphingomonas sp.]|uniref:glycosyltransferase family 4 protein n=1 Tax=Sphingomonas sp. TaxID=28214 RepID=UPI0017ACA9B2|nr:glycosyltransferase family 4 protein [Sphingomonas sp.]MBA3666267.1 glycosyltransferase family 4 protein [Sphingomonas sp.]